jgi:hypothetical protein
MMIRMKMVVAVMMVMEKRGDVGCGGAWRWASAPERRVIVASSTSPPPPLPRILSS